MKLRNKKTGEIVEFGYLQTDYVAPLVLTTYENAKPVMYTYTSLAELNAEWKDYEEPKEYWRITDLGELKSIRLDQHHQNIEKCKEIGNYFETKEEAEKAAGRLRAWKRLKDNGFKLKGWYMPKNMYKIEIDGGFSEDVSVCDYMDDLDKVFGGE